MSSRGDLWRAHLGTAPAGLEGRGYKPAVAAGC